MSNPTREQKRLKRKVTAWCKGWFALGFRYEFVVIWERSSGILVDWGFCEAVG